MHIPIHHDSTEQKGKLGPVHYYRGAETQEELMAFLREEIESSGGRKIQVIANMWFESKDEYIIYKSGGSPLEYFDDLYFDDQWDEVWELGITAQNMATRRAIISDEGYEYSNGRGTSDWGVIFYD